MKKVQDNKIVKIDYSNIYDYMENRVPYVFVDEAEVIVGKSAKGFKQFTMNEWFFKCHFPNNPIVPATFMFEAISQTAGLCIQTMDIEDKQLLVKKTGIDVFAPVRPGYKVYIDAEIYYFRRGIIKAKGRAYSEKDGAEVLHCTADIQLVMPNVLKQFAPTIK